MTAHDAHDPLTATLDGRCTHGFRDCRHPQEKSDARDSEVSGVRAPADADGLLLERARGVPGDAAGGDDRRLPVAGPARTAVLADAVDLAGAVADELDARANDERHDVADRLELFARAMERGAFVLLFAGLAAAIVSLFIRPRE